jgi:hypothetical protein
MVVGVALLALAVAYAVKEDDYGLAVAAGIGTTLALAVPLFWLERRLEQRVSTAVKERVDEAQADTKQSLAEVKLGLQQVRESVGHVNERVEELNRSAQERARQRRQARQASSRAPAEAALDGTFRSAYDALQQGRGIPPAIASTVYVTAGNEGWVLGFTSGDGQITVNVSHSDGRDDIAVYVWRDGETLDDVVDALDTMLSNELGEDEAPTLDQTGTVLGDLVKLLLFAQDRLRKAGTAAPPSPARQRPNEHWLITEGTIEHVGDPAVAYPLRLTLNGGQPPSDAPDRDALVRAWPIAYARHMRY